MSSRIEGVPYVRDVIEQIADERKKLEKNVASPEYKSSSDYDVPNRYCNVCGKKDKFFLVMNFSFCNEYDCGIMICGECVKKFPKIFADGVAGKQR